MFGYLFVHFIILISIYIYRYIYLFKALPRIPLGLALGGWARVCGLGAGVRSKSGVAGVVCIGLWVGLAPRSGMEAADVCSHRLALNEHGKLSARSRMEQKK